MDFSWLGEIFSSLLGIFKPLAKIAHWKIWAAIWDVINRLRSWYKWYQTNVQARMRAMQQLYNQLYAKWVAPILKIVDTVRRLTGIVGLVNHKLAAKLNTLFLRVEGYLLEPLNQVIARINKMERIFGGFLTPLGFLDRATLLNSFWRDIGLLRNLLRNPLGGSIASVGTPALGDFELSFSATTNALLDTPSDLSQSVDASVTIVQQYLGAR